MPRDGKSSCGACCGKCHLTFPPLRSSTVMPTPAVAASSRSVRAGRMPDRSRVRRQRGGTRPAADGRRAGLARPAERRAPLVAIGETHQRPRRSSHLSGFVTRARPYRSSLRSAAGEVNLSSDGAMRFRWRRPERAAPLSQGAARGEREREWTAIGVGRQNPPLGRGDETRVRLPRYRPVLAKRRQGQSGMEQ